MYPNTVQKYFEVIKRDIYLSMQCNATITGGGETEFFFTISIKLGEKYSDLKIQEKKIFRLIIRNKKRIAIETQCYRTNNIHEMLMVQATIGQVN